MVSQRIQHQFNAYFNEFKFILTPKTATHPHPTPTSFTFFNLFVFCKIRRDGNEQSDMTGR